MDISIYSHPTAKPTYEAGDTVTFSVEGNLESGGPETYQWYINGLAIPAEVSDTYVLTMDANAIGSYIQCAVNGRFSNKVTLDDIDSGVPTTITRKPVDYNYDAGGTATIIFEASGTGMTYSVTDPGMTEIDSGTMYAGETVVTTTIADPTPGTYTVNVIGTGGVDSASCEIVLDDEILDLTVGRAVLETANLGRVVQAGFRDLDGVGFGGLTRSPRNLVQFTADEVGQVVLRVTGGAQLPGALTTAEVIVSGLARVVLTYNGATGNYEAIDRSIYEAISHNFDGEVIKLDLRASSEDSTTLTPGKGNILTEDKVGFSGDFGALTGTVAGLAVEEIHANAPFMLTNTVKLKLADDTIVYDSFGGAEAAIAETGTVIQLLRDPKAVSPVNEFYSISEQFAQDLEDNEGSPVTFNVRLLPLA